MEKKILALMIALLVLAAVVASVALALGGGGGGGLSSSGGFTALFDDLDNMGNETWRAYLEAPDNWDNGDDVKVTDVIVDMFYERVQVGNTYVYTTTLYFAYTGDKWNDPTEGTYFYVPVDRGDGWLRVNHGTFSIEVSSATNLSEEYKPGDRITLETNLVLNDNVMLSFGVWVVENTL